MRLVSVGVHVCISMQACMHVLAVFRQEQDQPSMHKVLPHHTDHMSEQACVPMLMMSTQRHTKEEYRVWHYLLEDRETRFAQSDSH